MEGTDAGYRPGGFKSTLLGNLIFATDASTSEGMITTHYCTLRDGTLRRLDLQKPQVVLSYFGRRQILPLAMSPLPLSDMTVLPLPQGAAVRPLSPEEICEYVLAQRTYPQA